MIRLLFITLFITSFLSSSAREIYGRVLSDADSVAVVGAECRLKIDGRYIDGAVTDVDGLFRITTKDNNALVLEIGLVGFSTTEVVVKQGGGNLNLGDIYLTSGVELSEVTVTANSMIDARGRTVVYPSGSDVKSSSTSIRLFEKLPLDGLSANPVNRTITVDGGTPVILIDGVPSSLDDFQAVSPKDIERIEYSRITPARYADRGATGFINITLKKRNDGGEVYLWGRSAVATAFVDGNLRASYHQGPSQFSVSYNPSWRNYKKVFDDNFQSFIGDDFRVDLEEHDRNPFNYFSNPVQMRYTLSPSSHTLFSATFNVSEGTNKRRYYGSTSDSVLGDYSNHNESSGSNITPSLDLYVRHDFNDKNSIEAQMVGTLGFDDYRRTNRYFYPDGTDNSYVMDVDSRRRSLISEISYTHSFSDRTSLSAGYQNTVSHNRNRYITSESRPVLTENNNYVYASLGQQMGPVYLWLSTGAKLFWIRNDHNKRHFIRNLSTARLSWNIDSKWNVTGAFQYSPSIPTLAQLTDNPQQTSPYLVSNGNPNLKVAELFTYRLMPSFRYKKFSSAISLSYTNGRNSVFNDLVYLGDGKFLSQSVNSRRLNTYVGSLSLRVSDIAGFGANVAVQVSHFETGGEGWTHDLTSVCGYMTLWWNKGPWTLSYWRKFPGKYLSGHYVGKDENGDALSVEFRPSKHWNIGLDWMYMFDKKGTRYPSWNYSSVNPSANRRNITHNGNMVVINVQYTVDFGSIFRTSNRSLNNSDYGSSLLKM